MTPEQEYQEILQDMMEGNPIIYSLRVDFWDDSSKLYCFTTEESQVEYMEYLREHLDKFSIQSMMMYESMIDTTDEDDEFFIVH